MKKLLLLFILVTGIVSTGFSQYYYIPHLTPKGSNPGGLNNDFEQPVGYNAGWTSILAGPLASPTWSPTETIPFTFMFNGGIVSSYKVSSSGVLTFSTSSVSAPPSANLNLPDASIPDSSVCVWGLEASGTNDEIAYKTFGTAPNRQYWISFVSYNGLGTLTGCFTYWSIVLEETTNKIYLVDQRTPSTCAISLTLGIQINSSTATEVSGSPSIVALTSDAVDSPVDNVYYEFIYGTQPTYDISANAFTMEDYLDLNNAPFSITGTIDNYGTATINSLDINYSIDGGSVITASISGLSITTGGSYNFSHSTTWTPSITGIYTIEAWATNINGNADENSANDTITTDVSVGSGLPQRMILIEEFTQASCVPCAAQNLAFNALLSANESKLVSVKYHTSWPGVDPMNTFNAADVNTRVYYYIDQMTGVPHAIMDGSAILGVNYAGAPANLDQNMIDEQYLVPAPYDIEATAMVSGPTLTIDVTTTARAEIISGDLKVHVVLIEDPVEYTSPPGSNGETSFPHTMRAMFPDASGSSIGTPTINQADNFSFTYTIPVSLVTSNLKVVVFIQDDDTKEVHQAALATSNVGIYESNTSLSKFNIYPNPSKDVATLKYKLENDNNVKISVYNSIGELVYHEDLNSVKGSQSFKLNTSNLTNGIYLVTLSTDGQIFSRKLSVKK